MQAAISPATLISALVWSSILSLTAIGITLLYRTTRVPNFAHASFVTTGIYASTIVWVFGFHPYLGIPVGFVLGGLEAVLLFYAILEPLRRRKASIFLLMIATLSFDILMYGVLNVLADTLQFEFKILSRNIYFVPMDFNIGGIQGVVLISFATFLATFIALQLLLYRTNLGVALRACMENPALAQTLGVNVSRMLLLSWFIAGATAGVAGALMPFYQMCNVFTGTYYLAEMFCASIMGGLDYLIGAPIGSFILGFAKIFLLSFLASTVGPDIINYMMIIPLGVMVIVLATLPTGIASLIMRR
ncbi:MAG: branched-chain amino acid ABC transporter permease [Candidatus Korarchaeum sp.]